MECYFFLSFVFCLLVFSFLAVGREGMMLGRSIELAKTHPAAVGLV